MPMFIADSASVQFTPNTDLIGVNSFSALSIQLAAQPYAVILPIFVPSASVTKLSEYTTTGTLTPAGKWSDLEISQTPLTFSISEKTEDSKSWTEIVFKLTNYGTPTVGTFVLANKQDLLNGQTGTCTFFQVVPLA